MLICLHICLGVCVKFAHCAHIYYSCAFGHVKGSHFWLRLLICFAYYVYFAPFCSALLRNYLLTYLPRCGFCGHFTAHFDCRTPSSQTAFAPFWGYCGDCCWIWQRAAFFRFKATTKRMLICSFGHLVAYSKARTFLGMSSFSTCGSI